MSFTEQIERANAEQLLRDAKRAADRAALTFVYVLKDGAAPVTLPSIVWVSDEYLRSLGFAPRGKCLPTKELLQIRLGYGVQPPIVPGQCVTIVIERDTP